MNEILKLQDLSVEFKSSRANVKAVRNVSLSVNKSEVLALVGESGCGKTVLSRSVMKLLPPNAVIKSGKIILENKDITNYSEKQMKPLRGKVLSMVFQDPMTTLNPTIPVGKQIEESILMHEKISKDEAKKRAIEMLDMVGIDDSLNRYALQPHFFSGGMRQRCVLAIALALRPKLLFADEPTTALDVTIQARILDLLNELKKNLGLSIVFISHDMGVVSRIADKIAVMYAGTILEIGTSEEIFFDPRHPYTWSLLSSLPSMAKKGEKLRCIQGMPPDLTNPPVGDPFAPRNPYALSIDYKKMPPMFKITDTHYAASWLLDERAPKVQRPDIFSGGGF